MSEVYSGLRKRRKRTHPSKCPCCIADQEVGPENEASAGSENTVESKNTAVSKESKQNKRKRATKRKADETRSESESEQNYNETKSPSKKRKLRKDSEESPQQSTSAKKVSKTKAKSNHEKSAKSDKTLTNSKTKKGGTKTKNISNKELKNNNKITKTSEHDSDEDNYSDGGGKQCEDDGTKPSKNKDSSHNIKTRKATKSNGARAKPRTVNTKTKQGIAKTEEDDEEDHITSKSVKVKKAVSKKVVKAKPLKRVPVEKPSLAFTKTANKTKGSASSQVMQLKISVFDNLYSKLKSKHKDISIEEAAEMLTKISSDNLQMAFKSSQKPDKLGNNSSRQEKKVISDTEEIVSQAAEALVSFRAKSPISREDPSKIEKVNSTQSSLSSTAPSLNTQAGEKVKPYVTSATSAVQALMQFQSSSSVPSTFPSVPTVSSLPHNMLHGVLPTVSLSQSLSQSFPQLLQPNLSTSFTNLMPMVSSHATLPSFSQIAAHLRPPPTLPGMANTLTSNPSGMQHTLLTPSLSSVPSPSLMLPNQPLLQPQLQQPLPLTNPVTSSKQSLAAVKNIAPTVEATVNKTTTQKQNPLQQPLKGMEEVVGNVGTNVPQPILWNLKSPVVFLGSPQNLGGVPRNLVASPSTSQSGTSLEQAGYRPVAPKPVTKPDTSHAAAAPVSSVPNLLTLGGRPILPRTQLQGGDDSKKLQPPQSGMSFVSQLPSMNPSHPYQAAASTLQPLTQVTSTSPKKTTLMSVNLPSSSIITNLPSSSNPVGQPINTFMQQNFQDNSSVKCTSQSSVSAKQAVKKLVHERTKSAELKKEASGSANPHPTTKLKAILPLPPKDPTTSTVTSTETKNNEFNLEQAATALLSIGVPDGIETIGLKQGSSDPSKDDYEEDVVFTSKGTFRVGDVDVDPRYNRIGREGYTCGKCNKIFTSLSYLARHIKRVCPDMSCRKWKCTLCDKAFRHPFGLQQHVYTHTGERPHKCPLCPKAFYSSNDLRRHSRIHSGERPYRCKHCDKSFATTISLKTHTYIHTGEKPHKCPQCPKTFATSSKLGRHIVTHSEQRPYSCDQCPKSFNRSGDLRRHNLAVHDGKDKSFECDVCPATFTKSADLRRHNATVHQKTIKTLQCEDCGTQFTTQLCLKMHRDTYHKKPTDSDKIPTCDVCGKTYSNTALLTKHKATHESSSTTAYNLSQFQHIAPKPSEQVTNEGGTG